VRDVQDLVEAAIGGMPISTVIDGRSRFSINVRYAADFRADPRALQDLLVPIPAAESLSFARGNSAGRGSAPIARAEVQSRGGGMGNMGSGGGMEGAPMSGGASTMSPTASADDLWERWRQSGTVVPLAA